jgi:hypothetical protein
MAAVITLLFVPFLSAPANAYHSRHSHHSRNQVATSHKHSYRHLAHYRSGDCVLTNSGRRVCNSHFANEEPPVLDAAGNRTFAMVDAGTVIGSRPGDCPHAYCGCGLRKYLGLSDVRLNLASNWARLLPREGGPGVGLAAVRNHHVMYLEGTAGDGQWLVRDYNSGGGLSRVHVRDVRGYIFVNPHARVASQ